MTSTRTRRRLVTIAAIAAVAAAGAAGAWAWSGRQADDPGTAGATGTADPTPGAAATVVTEPADPADVATDVPTSVPAPGADVDVVVSFAGWDDATSAVEVNAFVGGVVEEGGTCTLELTGAGDPITVEAPAEADASTTVCGLLTTAGTDVAPGTWDAVVTYTSPSSTGTSAGTSVEVPR